MWQGNVLYVTCKGHVFRRSVEWLDTFLEKKRVEAASRPKEEPRVAVIGKICYGCDKDKSLSEFHSNSSKVDGIASLCKACARDKNVKYYSELTNKKELRAYRLRFTEGAKYDSRSESARDDS